MYVSVKVWLTVAKFSDWGKGRDLYRIWKNLMGDSIFASTFQTPRTKFGCRFLRSWESSGWKRLGSIEEYDASSCALFYPAN